ncbi:uncharacterized protein LOC142241064 [Haematobia irritans]|uniref:uncharacterized protein LOC142241064 n=1 Tax=Haematobia irritans TaxID=7368 RepID=UPI003F500AB5
MSILVRWLLTAIACGLLGVYSVNSTCQECMANDAYCIDETSYYLCLDGNTPSKSNIYTCKDGEVCTDDEKICVPKTVASSVCSGSCSQCSAGNRYTCTSRTNFGRCIDGKIAISSPCEKDYVCSTDIYATAGTVCVPECVAEFHGVTPTCANEETTTTTTTAAPFDPAVYKTMCENDLPNHSENPFYILNALDNTCQSYIYCESFNAVMEALLMKCKTGYYHPQENKCKNDMPADCMIESSSESSSVSSSDPPSTDHTQESVASLK